MLLPSEAKMTKVRVSKETQRLFLKLLNFTPELLDKTQKEAKLQNTSFDALVRLGGWRTLVCEKGSWHFR
jgi:hypothetical protein